MKFFLGWIFEFFFAIIYTPICIVLGYLFPLERINARADKKYPIVFVHGWFVQNPFSFFFKRYFEKRGYRVYMTNFGLHTEDLSLLAKRLRNFMEKHDLHDTILVGASIGGVIILDYLQNHKGWNRSRQFISIATPFYGTYRALLAAPFSKAARQIIPKNKYLKSLHSLPIFHPEKIFCIQTKYDEVIPFSRSRLIGVKHTALPVIGHARLQLSRKTYKAIRQTIIEHTKRAD